MQCYVCGEFFYPSDSIPEGTCSEYCFARLASLLYPSTSNQEKSLSLSQFFVIKDSNRSNINIDDFHIIESNSNVESREKINASVLSDN